MSSPLLEDINLAGAHGILVNVTAGMDLSIGEFEIVGNTVKKFASDDATVVVGHGDRSGDEQPGARHRGGDRSGTAFGAADRRTQHVPQPQMRVVASRGRGADERPPTTPRWTSRRCSGSARWVMGFAPNAGGEDCWISRRSCAARRTEAMNAWGLRAR